MILSEMVSRLLRASFLDARWLNSVLMTLLVQDEESEALIPSKKCRRAHPTSEITLVKHTAKYSKRVRTDFLRFPMAGPIALTIVYIFLTRVDV